MTTQSLNEKIALTTTSTVTTVFEQLAGTWNLKRLLISSNAAEPSGNCTGVAVLSSREPSIFINRDGKLEQADAEMLYHEYGEFEMQQANPSQYPSPKFSFSRKYVWRLEGVNGKDNPKVSIWFTKPGTDQIDYLFHRINMGADGFATAQQDVTACSLEGECGHLCEEDFYSSSYSFQLLRNTTGVNGHEETIGLKTWTMQHDVRGPQKDQEITTTFTKV